MAIRLGNPRCHQESQTSQALTREDLLNDLVAQIVARKKPDKPFRVGIDGRSAAGKSTLADALGSAVGGTGLNVLRPSIDGYHHSKERRYQKGEFSAAGYYEDAYNYQAVIEYLLEPLSGDAFPVLCRQVAHNWRTDMVEAAPPIPVDAASVLLFDGLFLFRRELNTYWDFRILLDIDYTTSLSRALERDKDVLGEADLVRKKYEMRYEPAWLMYVDQEHPESRAETIVDNRDFMNPKIIKNSGAW
jgi:uridine kinase